MLLVTLTASPNRPGQNVLTAVVASARKPPPPPPARVELRFPGREAATPMRAVGAGRFLLAGDQLSASGASRIDVVVHRRGEPAAPARFGWTTASAPHRVAGLRPAARAGPHPAAALLASPARWPPPVAMSVLARPAARRNESAAAPNRRPPGRTRHDAPMLVLCLRRGATPVPPRPAGSRPHASTPTCDSSLAALARDELLPVIVRLRSQEDVSASAARVARSGSSVSSARCRRVPTARSVRCAADRRLSCAAGRVRDVRSCGSSTALRSTPTPAVIRLLAAHPLVERVIPGRDARGAGHRRDRTLGGQPRASPTSLRSGPPASAHTASSSRTSTRASTISIPTCAAQWRGGTNSWYDPADSIRSRRSTPAATARQPWGSWSVAAKAGHRSASRPTRRWIAAKIFDDGGMTTLSRIHQAYQWVLDPGPQSVHGRRPAGRQQLLGVRAPGMRHRVPGRSFDPARRRHPARLRRRQRRTQRYDQPQPGQQPRRLRGRLDRQRRAVIARRLEPRPSACRG